MTVSTNGLSLDVPTVQKALELASPETHEDRGFQTLLSASLSTFSHEDREKIMAGEEPVAEADDEANAAEPEQGSEDAVEGEAEA